MSRFDDEVDQRFAEIRAVDRIEAAKEKAAVEEDRQLTEALAADVDQRVGSRRLVVTVVPADEVFDAYAKFLVEVRHRQTNIVLGHVLQRDFSAPPRFVDEAEANLNASMGPAPPKMAYFFEPTILYEDMELQGYVCDTAADVDPIQFDRPAFLDWLFNELVEVTAAHEQATRS